ncbi:MAG: FAD-dependent oxidoreductase [Pseudomonadota bacterium]
MYDVLVIGAGFAGLAAAKRLDQAGCANLAVLEARDRVGGRTRHGVVGGLDVDLGGMWLGPSQTRLAEWAQHYQVRTYPTHLEGKAIYRLGGKEHHGDREDLEGAFGWLEGFDYLSASRQLEKLSAGIDCDAPWDHPQAAKLDGQTVETWLTENVRSARLRELFRVLCYALFCAEASQISMLFFLHYVKSGDNLDVLVSADKGGAQNFMFHGGVHQIARKMAEELGDRVHLNAPVTRIEQTSGHIIVSTAQDEWKARSVIVSVPPTLVPKIDFTPALPRPKAALHAKLAMGSAIKYWIVYETPFWRAQGFNGLIIRDDVACTPCMDVSPPGQPKGVIAGFFDGDHALTHGDAGMEARRGQVVAMLAEHFGKAAETSLEYRDVDWTAEDWSAGCYGAYAAPGVYARYGAWLRRPVGSIYWAGTETSPRWTGYIDGAIRSGERAAEEVLAAHRDGAIGLDSPDAIDGAKAGDVRPAVEHAAMTS